MGLTSISYYHNRHDQSLVDVVIHSISEDETQTHVFLYKTVCIILNRLYWSSALIGRGTFELLEILGNPVRMDMGCKLVPTQVMRVIVRPVATAVLTHVCLVVAVARSIYHQLVEMRCGPQRWWTRPLLIQALILVHLQRKWATFIDSIVTMHIAHNTYILCIQNGKKISELIHPTS